DIRNDGWCYRMGWTTGGDAFLAIDANGDGRITGRDELAFKGYRPGAQTDLQGLAAFDSNGDGQISTLDALWGELRVWRDANGNGVSDDGEVRSLEQAGVQSISLASDQQFSTSGGNVINGRTTVTMTDGSTVA